MLETTRQLMENLNERLDEIERKQQEHRKQLDEIKALHERAWKILEKMHEEMKGE